MSQFDLSGDPGFVDPSNGAAIVSFDDYAALQDSGQLDSGLDNNLIVPSASNPLGSAAMASGNANSFWGGILGAAGQVLGGVGIAASGIGSSINQQAAIQAAQAKAKKQQLFLLAGAGILVLVLVLKRRG